jgi:hypothetical protein
MNTIANHDQKIALSDRDRALVLALLLSHRQSLEADFKRKSGRVWRPTHADMEQVWEYELTIRLISQLEAAAANHDAAE